MKVTKLKVKRHTGLPMTTVGSIEIRRGRGVLDTVHEDPLSPRQLLLGDAEVYSAAGEHADRLRWNLEITDFCEAVSPGDLLGFSSGAVIWLTMTCEPCAQLKGIQDWSSLGARRGILAMAVANGPVHVGDEVRILGNTSPLPDRPADRFCAALDSLLNERSVVDIRQMLRASGLQSVYARAVPVYLAAARNLGLPWFRVVRTSGDVFDRFRDEQLHCLRDAGLLDARSLFDEMSTPTVTNDLRSWLDVRELNVPRSETLSHGLSHELPQITPDQTDLNGLEPDVYLGQRHKPTRDGSADSLS